MSVTDPYIKEIKGVVQQFLQIISQHSQINDNDFYLATFCNLLEKIFESGLIRQQNTLYFIRYIDSAYCWMSSIVKEKSVSLTYINCVDQVKSCSETATNRARFRLLVRYCLVKKCVHVPVEYLIRNGKSDLFYSTNSIIGDEILSEIFLSVLYQISKFNFNLQLENASFLDVTWYIPQLLHLELVPCHSIGLSISYAAERAVIVAITPDSVAAETGKINIGDVLLKLNGEVINSSVKGRLSSLLKYKRNRPILLTIAKAFNDERQEFFNPIKFLFKEVHLNHEVVVQSYKSDLRINNSKENSSGFNVTYLGCVDVGPNGNVKQVGRAIRKLLLTGNHLQKDLDHDDETVVLLKLRQPVIFEIGEIGVKVKDFETKDLVLDHSYMKISSCGSVPFNDNHFGYIAGEENCDVAKKFLCHIFEVKNVDLLETILQSIGQGFRRTHFAV